MCPVRHGRGRSPSAPMDLSQRREAHPPRHRPDLVRRRGSLPRQNKEGQNLIPDAARCRVYVRGWNSQKDPANVRNLAYLALCENDQTFITEAGYAGRATCVIHTWRVLYSCFSKGAWSCLAQDTNLRARHVFFLPRARRCPVWYAARGECGWLLVTWFGR